MKKIFLIILLFAASLHAQSPKKFLINTSHLNHLYEDIFVNGDTLGIIHIYAEYPDYNWIDDSDEGTACVDDAARALIFYLNHYQLTNDSLSLVKAERLLKFLFYMQAENGYFCNFIWKDNSINKDFKTSIAEPNWWSWRALWAMAEAELFFKKKNEDLSAEIITRIKKLLDASSGWLMKDTMYAVFEGFRLPAWLPYETASDQAAVIIKGLCTYFNSVNDSSVLPLIRQLSKGIAGMQTGDKNEFPHFAFLSWQNTWHAWGNSQADALLASGILLNDSSFVKAALNEIDNFYPYLIRQNFYSDFSVEKKNDSISILAVHHYPQIAYGIRPMIFASVSAYHLTGDEKYAKLAAEIAGWFFGKNINSAEMYSIKTGRGYDGINDEQKVNLNSGAESTIEALLSLIAVEKNEAVKKYIDY